MTLEDDTAVLADELFNLIYWGSGPCIENQDLIRTFIWKHIVTPKAQRLAALEAALAAKDEAIRDAIQPAGTMLALRRLQALPDALSLTRPEALARREAERRIISAAVTFEVLSDAVSALAALDQAKESR